MLCPIWMCLDWITFPNSNIRIYLKCSAFYLNLIFDKLLLDKSIFLKHAIYHIIDRLISTSFQWNFCVFVTLVCVAKIAAQNFEHSQIMNQLFVYIYCLFDKDPKKESQNNEQKIANLRSKQIILNLWDELWTDKWVPFHKFCSFLWMIRLVSHWNKVLDNLTLNLLIPIEMLFIYFRGTLKIVSIHIFTSFKNVFLILDPIFRDEPIELTRAFSRWFWAICVTSKDGAWKLICIFDVNLNKNYQLTRSKRSSASFPSSFTKSS